MVGEAGSAKLPAAADQRYVNVSAVSASVAVAVTSIWPPSAAAVSGEVDQNARAGQLSPGTTVPVTRIDPSPPSGVTDGQIKAMLTGVVWPATTSNGVLDPEQVSPPPVVAAIVTTYPLPFVSPSANEALAPDRLVSIVPDASTWFDDDLTVHETFEVAALAGRTKASMT